MRPAALSHDEWEADRLIMESGHICSSCGEDIRVLDEVFLLQVVYPGHDAEGSYNTFILQDSEGGYVYEPQFLHLDCWEELWTNFEEYLEEIPTHEDGNAVEKCYGCESSIWLNEVSGLLSLGELRCSQRAPNGSSTIYFDPCNNRSQLLCISCLFLFNSDVFEMWDEFSFQGACPRGHMEKCWRHGTCTHGCHHSFKAAG